MNFKIFIPIGIILVVGVGIGYGYIHYGNVLLNKADTQPTACTMDAQVCPDGSSVGRVGPACEFEACPAVETPPKACTEEALLCPDGTAVGRTGPNCSFADCPAVGDVTWHFLDKSMTPDETPRTEVLTAIGGIEYSLGEYVGSCGNTQQDSVVAGVVSSVLCWWGGAGTEIAIFKDGNGFVVKIRDIEEGTAEIPGAVGKFEELLRILPAK